MNTSLYEYGNTIIQNSMKNPNIETGMGVFYLINIILFGSVIIFIGIFIYNFIRSYKGNDVINFSKKSDKTNYVKQIPHSLKQRISQNSNVCSVCGKVNDDDSRFCKNCGNKL